ncbi:MULTISPECIES: PTS glucose transporter subunit IIA [unclassified Pseudoalteromonas]|uniref:PTS glucose transporter subunit IIA n=1 Tax=unclassified Pseudoalteromonas TaxID=194690 RepID=UPI000CF5E5F8|nr:MULTISPECIES: PTS glucose transporter subunit IIA [unclassified Pseudoalteromonas]MBS3796927.1 PTS glucose transporter subunit IIA [Pseudoalteromonas sp. BDTF-M6]
MNYTAQLIAARELSQSTLPSTATLYAPLSGAVLPLTEAPDALMALGLLGPGVCIQMRGHKLLAPCDGTLVKVSEGAKQWHFRSQHGLEILLYLHLDEPSICNKAKLKYLDGATLTRGEEIAYFDLRQFKSAPLAAIMITNLAPSTLTYYCQQQVAANEPLLFIGN